MIGLTAAALTLSIIASTLAGPAPATPSLAPSAVPSPATRLKEIGHARAITDFCSAALDRTNLGIRLALENDRRIGEVQNALRFDDFDASEITRRNAIHQLVTEFAAIHAAAAAGNAQMALLREALKDTPTPDQRAALQQMQEALDGALTRQKRLADKIGRLTVILENRDRIDPDTRSQQQFDALQAENSYQAAHDPQGPLANLPASLSETAKASATDIASDAEGIGRDEDDTSDRLDAAFAACL